MMRHSDRSGRVAGTGVVALALTGFVTATVHGQCEVTKIIASDAVENAEFGASAMDGQVLVVGAGADLTGSLPGAAYVYRFDGTTWNEEAKLEAPDGEPGDRFGSVAISGDVIIAGAYRDDEAGLDAGAVYVFRHEGSVWTMVQKIVPSGVGADDWFGIVPDVGGGWALLPAPRDDEAGENAGAVYAYRQDGSTWVETQKIVPDDLGAGDGFGFPCSIGPCGRVAVIGAYQHDAGAEDAGAAYVYRRDGTTWVREAKLIASDPEPGDFFGLAARIDRDTVVASSFDDDRGENAGAVYVFRFDGAAWSQEAKLTAAGVEANDWFGADVVVRGDVLVASAINDDDGGEDAGAAYVFRYAGDSWTETAKLVSGDPDAGDWFGNVLAASGDHLALGARFDDEGGEAAGAAYVFAGLLGVDYNGNGVADVCEALCPADATGDGTVDFADVLRLLTDWGPCPG